MSHEYISTSLDQFINVWQRLKKLLLFFKKIVENSNFNNYKQSITTKRNLIALLMMLVMQFTLKAFHLQKTTEI